MNNSSIIKGVTLEKPLEQYIDHTLLKPDADEAQIKQLCTEALTFLFASVCVNSCHIPFVAEALRGSAVKTCAVVGFPLGAMLSEAKAYETKAAITAGAQEIDMVINVGALKSGDLSLVEKDIADVVVAADKKALVKVIIEACLLTDDEKVAVCKLAKSAGADFVKTSTGFSTGGAVETDVAIMRKTVGAEMGVKASGGIRDLNAALAMIRSGANRIGTSAGIKIMQQAEQERS